MSLGKRERKETIKAAKNSTEISNKVFKMDTLFSISPPEHFDFSDFGSWPNWIRRFERFRIAAGISERSQEYQVNSLIYTMGDKADDIMCTLALSEADRKEYDKVKEAFGKHFVCKHNVIYERAKFNKRCQEPGESAEMFITAVHKLAENCQYGVLQEEMIRDRLVVGIRDHRLSERLQLDPELTLSKAITKIRQSEEIKKQQTDLRQASGDPNEVNLDMLKYKVKPRYAQKGPQWRPDSTRYHGASKGCGRCGKPQTHSLNNCPARDAECRTCKKKGHFAAVCKTKKKIDEIYQGDEAESIETVFLGVVKSENSTDVWQRPIIINGKQIIFKLDTGAVVTAIPERLYSKRSHGILSPPTKKLCGPSNKPIPVRGQFDASLNHQGKIIKHPVFVIPRLVIPLLGLPAIKELNLLHTVDVIQTSEPNYKELFPKVFTGLGKLEGAYKIKLKESTTPFALSVPRRVPLPMMNKVKEELKRMEDLGVIAPIEEATEWCSGMVVVPKPNGKIRICVDLTHLNNNVCRERHILPAVDETLAKLPGATVFSKLDATAGFWQIPLHKDSVPLTTLITTYGRYCFHRLPFGISSAPEHFQKRLTQMLDGLEGTLCHADDILVFGSTRKEHDARLVKVLDRLQQKGLTLNEKCQFAVP